MTPSSNQDEIRQMHARKMVMEQARLNAEKEIIAELKDLNATLRVLASAISNKIATA